MKNSTPIINNNVSLFTQLQESIIQKQNQIVNINHLLMPLLKEDNPNNDKKNNNNNNNKSKNVFDKLNTQLDTRNIENDNTNNNNNDFVDLDLDPPVIDDNNVADNNNNNNNNNNNVTPPPDLNDTLPTDANNTLQQNDLDPENGVNNNETSLGNLDMPSSAPSAMGNTGLNNNDNMGGEKTATDTEPNQSISTEEEETYFDGDQDNQEIVDLEDNMEDEEAENGNDNIVITTKQGEEKVVLMDKNDSLLENNSNIFEIDSKYLEVLLNNDWNNNIFVIDNVASSNLDNIKIINEIVDVDNDCVYIQLSENQLAALYPIDNLDNNIQIVAIPFDNNNLFEQ